jgi:hypothetical protein
MSQFTLHKVAIPCHGTKRFHIYLFYKNSKKSQDGFNRVD